MLSRVHRRGFVALACFAVAVVQGCGGGSASSGAPSAPLAVTSVTPAELPLGGGSVTVRGTGFDPGTRVVFGSGAAEAVTFISPTELDAVAPPHAAGAVDVDVDNPDGAHAALPASLRFVVTPPTLASISPSSGPTAGSTSVVLSGASFGAGATVTFGGVAAAISTSSAPSIAVTTPPHAAGAVDVVVTNVDGQSSTLAAAFTYVAPPPPAAPPPSLASAAPASGTTLGGTIVTLAGASFQPGATVTFNGTAGVVGAVTPTSITVTTPAHPAGAADVTVTNPDGQSATLPAAFTYAMPPPPSVGVTSPNTGTANGEEVVTVNGLNFLPGATVTFGGTPGLVTSVTATAITVTTPAGAAGAVAVAVTNPDGQASSLAGGYTYTAPAAPATGVTLTPSLASPQPAGTFVTFTAAGAGSSGYEYRFFLSTDAGATYALLQDWSIAPSWTAPASLAAGAYRIRVDVRTSPAVATFDAQTTVDYVLGAAPAAPFIASISPIAGSSAGSTTVTLTGGNFVAGTQVYFRGVPQRVVSLTATSIAFVTSPGITGLVDVSAVMPSNQAAIVPGGFEYTLPTRTPPPPPPPPPAGPLPPATGVTLTAAQASPQLAGTFVPFVAAGQGSVGYQYRFWLSADGGVTFALVQDWSFAHTWTTPASLAAGNYRIQVDVRTNASVLDASATTDFSLSPAPPVPVVAAVSPKTGSTAGTNAVTITGFDFLPGAVVRFGTTPQTVRTVTPTAITIITAPGAAGLVDVEVVNPTNEAALLPGGYDYTLPAK